MNNQNPQKKRNFKTQNKQNFQKGQKIEQSSQNFKKIKKSNTEFQPKKFSDFNKKNFQGQKQFNKNPNFNSNNKQFQSKKFQKSSQKDFQQTQKSFKNDQNTIKKFNNKNQSQDQNSKAETFQQQDKKDKKSFVNFDQTQKKVQQLVQTLLKKGKEDKSVNTGNKAELITQIWSLIGEPFLNKFVHKRFGSLAIQACLKFSKKEQKEKLVEDLLNLKSNTLNESGGFEEIIKSKYGHFIAVKIFKNKCCNKIQKDKIFQFLLKDAVQYATHNEASKVLDAFLKQGHATPHQLNLLKQIILTPFSQQKKNAQTKNNQPEEKQQLEKDQYLENLAIKVLEKNQIHYQISQFILSKAINILIPNEREKLIEAFQDQILNIGDNQDGLKLALQIINFSSAKQRKKIVKNCKDQIMSILNQPDSKAYIIILKFILTVDDTIILKKFILKELSSNMKQVFESSHGLNIISSIFIPNHNILKEIEQNLEHKETTSKKSDEQRRKEIILFLMPEIISYFNSKLKDSIIHRTISKIFTSVINFIFKEQLEEYIDLIKNFWKIVKEDLNKLGSTTNFEDINKNLIIANQDGSKVIKSLIYLKQEMSATSSDKLTSLYNEIFEDLMNSISSNLQTIIFSRAIFLVIAVIEQTNDGKILIEKLKKLKKMPNDNSIGMNILKGLIQ